MADLNATKWGRGEGPNSFTFSTARTANASAMLANPTGTDNSAVNYNRTGRGQHKFKRVFYYFDTSGITGSVSSVTLNIDGHSAGSNDADFIVIKSTGFGTDGGTDIVTSEFSSLDYTRVYSSEITSWTLSGNNAITLNGTAETDIQNLDAFIIAVIDHDNDYQNASSSSSTSTGIAIDFSTTGFLSYTEAASGYTHDVNGLAAASIGKVSSVATASIGKINSVD